VVVFGVYCFWTERSIGYVIFVRGDWGVFFCILGGLRMLSFGGSGFVFWFLGGGS
jgi:hypothetical protein